METKKHSMSWRSFRLRCFAIALVVTVTDQSIGRMIAHQAESIEWGDRIGAENRTIRSGADVLILGSSHAKHHYSDSILTEALGSRVWNGGADGAGILYAAAMLELTAKFRRPSVVLLEESWFPNEQEDLHRLDYFFGISPRVDSMLTADGWRSTLKLSSRLYRMNGLTSPLLRSFLTPSPAAWGFSPLDGTLQTVPTSRAMQQVSTLQVQQAERTIVNFFNRAHELGVRVVLVRSPTLIPTLPTAVRRVFELAAQKHSVPLVELSENDAANLDAPKFFSDATHLNGVGAIQFTSMIAPKLAANIQPKER